MRLKTEFRMERILNVQLSDIITGCKQRDDKCQRELYNRYFGLMMSICFRYCDCKQDAEDNVQEGFVKVFEKIDGFDDKGSFDGWMKRVFVNLCLDKIRKKKMQFLSIDEGENGEYLLESSREEEEEENQLLASVGRDNLLKAIQDLSPVYRTVFNLYVIEGYTHAEIAKHLNISEGTSKSNLFKAKKKLRKEVEAFLKSKYAS